MTKAYVLKVEPLKIRMSPYGFHKYGIDYFSAGDSWKKKASYSPVPYFLYCRSIELGLKAFLIAKGVKLNYVKNKLSHDLKKSLIKAKEHGLQDFIITSDDDETQIIVANRYYNTKGFEYFFVSNHVTGLSDLPDLARLREYADKLLTGITELVNNTNY